MIEPVEKRIRDVENAFSNVDNLPDDSEVRSHWAGYICVLISANLERCLRDIFSRFAKDNSSPSVHRYVKERLRWHVKPNYDRIIKLHSEFDAQWGKEIKKFIQGQKRDAIDSVVNNRNSIAHGYDYSIPIYDLREWFQHVKEIIEFSHDLVLKTTAEAHTPSSGDEGNTNG